MESKEGDLEWVLRLELHIAEQIPLSFWDDTDFVRKLVQVDPYALWHLPAPLCNNHEILRKGLLYNGAQLEALSDEQRNDWGLALASCSANQESIHWVSTQLRSHLPFYHAIAVTAQYVNEDLLDWLPIEYQLDEELMFSIVKHSAAHPVDLSAGLKTSLPFAKRLLMSVAAEEEPRDWAEDWYIESFSKEIKEDQALGLDVLTFHKDLATLDLNDTSYLQRGFAKISKTLRQDSHFLEQALRLDGRLLCALSEKQKEDPLLVTAALAQRLDVWPMAHPSLHQNPEFARYVARLAEDERQETTQRDFRP